MDEKEEKKRKAEEEARVQVGGTWVWPITS